MKREAEAHCALNFKLNARTRRQEVRSKKQKHHRDLMAGHVMAIGRGYHMRWLWIKRIAIVTSSGLELKCHFPVALYFFLPLAALCTLHTTLEAITTAIAAGTDSKTATTLTNDHRPKNLVSERQSTHAEPIPIRLLAGAKHGGQRFAKL
jgi:hypothetical protein